MKLLLQALVIIMIITSGCNAKSRQKRAEIDQKLEYFDMKIDTINRRIDAFNPVSLPLDYAMKVSDDLNSDIDSLNTQIEAFESTLFGEDLFAKHPISTKEQRDKYMGTIDQQVDLVDRMKAITLALDAKVNLMKQY